AVDPGRAAAARSRAGGLPVRASLRLDLRALHHHASAAAAGRPGPRGDLPPERPGGGGGAGVNAEPDGNLLEVENVVTRYPVARGIVGAIARRPALQVHAVEGVSFTVGSGEMVALVGESGCGKTSTAQTVVRMVDYQEGSIRFRGREIGKLSQKELRP